ncbi:30S ribosomal protein S2 [Nymphon striatum]|nr:30S ribosomal protein S2 [Nymphon striatum]
MRQLLEAGAHFGHQTSRWNPKMDRYIYGSRNNIHIIDLSQSVPLLDQALKVVSDTVAGGGRLLFVGTKRQASEIIADAAKRSAQYYVNARWLGGMLTNWNTISNDKLERALGGIKDMGGTPDILFIVDTNKESIALQEAKKLGIPVVAILDSNCDPDNVDYPIPGNDDAARAISLYCDLIAKAAIDGIARQQGSAGVDLGAAVEAPVEETLVAEPAPVAEAAPEAPAEAAPEPEAPVAKKEAPAAKEEAPAAEGAALFATPEGDPDDLKQISGVGPVLEGKLHALGVTKFAQVAAFTAEDIAKVDDALSFKGRIERDDWLKQAAELAKG